MVRWLLDWTAVQALRLLVSDQHTTCQSIFSGGALSKKEFKAVLSLHYIYRTFFTANKDSLSWLWGLLCLRSLPQPIPVVGFVSFPRSRLDYTTSLMSCPTADSAWMSVPSPGGEGVLEFHGFHSYSECSVIRPSNSEGWLSHSQLPKNCNTSFIDL